VAGGGARKEPKSQGTSGRWRRSVVTPGVAADMARQAGNE
jgi:hypothetical protein